MELRHGDCLEVMATLGAESVDSVVTDPPYGLEFMGKEWDRLGDRRQPGDANYPEPPENPFGRSKDNAQAGQAMQGWHQAWGTEALRILKPGGHLLAFGGTRTYHRLACALEDAGFEIRDTLCWLYGSGFPKSLNLDGEWQGWGTALKPAYEPIVLARKPLAGTVAANVLAHGTGALNVDGCRVQTDDNLCGGAYAAVASDRSDGYEAWRFKRGAKGNAGEFVPPAGRWPANALLDEQAAGMLDEQSGESVSTQGNPERGTNRKGMFSNSEFNKVGAEYDDSDGASRFFYVPKVDSEERNAGLSVPSLFSPEGAPERNAHPTVKPVELMRWLCRLITPPGGLILDPFLGSGTTGIAAGLEGFRFIGIEREEEYIRIAEARMSHWLTREIIGA